MRILLVWKGLEEGVHPMLFDLQGQGCQPQSVSCEGVQPLAVACGQIPLSLRGSAALNAMVELRKWQHGSLGLCGRQQTARGQQEM